jgi:hypothetical protein
MTYLVNALPLYKEVPLYTRVVADFKLEYRPTSTIGRKASQPRFFY